MVLVFRAFYDTRWARPRDPHASATLPPTVPDRQAIAGDRRPGARSRTSPYFAFRPQSDGSHPGCLGPVEGGEARLALRWNIEREEERIGIVG